MRATSPLLRSRPPILAAAAVTTALLLAACSNGGGGSSAASAAGSTSASQAAALTIESAQTGAGATLTGEGGRTLYVFLKDKDGTIACTGQCASNWPPLTVPAGSSASAGSGVTAAWLGTVNRPDGGVQVTYNGRPLYYYAKDAKAGDATGQGVLGLWFVAAPDGSAPTPAASAAPSASSATSSTGY